MRRALLFTAVLACLAAAVPARSWAAGATFYVSPSGSDTNPGTIDAPWRTIGRVNAAALQPGDRVLFAGGARFVDTALIPRTSGAPGEPISFGSYGSGRATLDASGGNDVWLPGGSHDFVFGNLDFEGSGILFASAATGAGVSDVTITDSSFTGTPQTALNISTHADHDWTITRSTFTHIGDSGLIVWGANVTISHCTIADTGWNSAISWGKHGIYDKGPDTTIAYNDISRSAGGQALSLRYHGTRVYGNVVHDTPYAVGFFDDDLSQGPQGTDLVYDNRFWNISGWAFYYSREADPRGAAPSVSFVLASNTFDLSRAIEAVNVSEVPSTAAVTLANNVFTGSYTSAYRGCMSCRESNNDWFGGSVNIPHGPGDLYVNPSLASAPRLIPLGRSPIVDAGTKLLHGLSYVFGCNAAALHYCGSAPDLGAVEFRLGGLGTSASGAGSSPIDRRGGRQLTGVAPTRHAVRHRPRKRTHF